MVKFGKQIKRLADDSQLNHCIAYDVLKKAINVVVAADKEALLPVDSPDLQAVKETFGQSTGIAGSGRPPDSRFHSLLQHELAKVNRFFNLQLRTLLDSLRDAQALASKSPPLNEDALLDLERRLDSAAEMLIAIEHFRRLNFTGFRKIVKKFDKQSSGSRGGSLGSWFLPALMREPFVAQPLDPHLLALAWGYAALRRHRNLAQDLGSPRLQPRDIRAWTAAAAAAAVAGNARSPTRTFWLQPPARMRALCTLVKRFHVVQPTPTAGAAQSLDSGAAAAAPITAEAAPSEVKSSLDQHLCQMRSLLHSMGPEGSARAPVALKAGNSLTFFDDPEFNQYLKRVHGEGPCGLRRRSTVVSGQESPTPAGAVAAGIIEVDGDQDALAGKNAFTVLDSPGQPGQQKPEGRPMAVVQSSRVILHGDTQATRNVSLALDEDVQFSIVDEQGVPAGGPGADTAIDFPYCLLEVACEEDEPNSWAWLDELWNFAALRTVQGFSVGAHAVACLYKDRVPKVPQWYQHLETMENSAPPEAWGLLLEWRAAVHEEPQTADATARRPQQPGISGAPGSAAELVPIEPKNFLASERTMLEWLHTVLALAILGVGLWKYSLSIESEPLGPPQPIALGLLNAATGSSLALGCYSLTLIFIALCFAWYAVMSHVRRLDALFANKHTERIFNWRPGPLLFAGFVGLALVSHLLAQIVPLWLSLGTDEEGSEDVGGPARQ